MATSKKPKDEDNPLDIQRKRAHRLMRHTIRQQVYLDKQARYQEPMEAKDTDIKVFYSLVNQQRSSKSTGSEVLHYDGMTYSSEYNVADAFADDLQELAMPSYGPDYDADYEAQVSFDKLFIETITSQQTVSHNLVTLKEIWQIINSFQYRCTGKVTLTVRNMFSQARSVVKWNGKSSSPFEIKQGVRQGGILSTLHYKLFNNDLLLLLQKMDVGMPIGYFNCCALTCADDVALLEATTLCLLLLLYAVKYYICREHYNINATKADIVLNHGRTATDGKPVMLRGDEICRSKTEVHLGVDRNEAAGVDIGARVQTGRRTMYARTWGLCMLWGYPSTSGAPTEDFCIT